MTLVFNESGENERAAYRRGAGGSRPRRASQWPSPLFGRRMPRVGAFTLVELVVTVAILAVVAAAIASALACGLHVWDRAQNFDARRMDALIGMEAFQKEIRSSFRFYAIEFAWEGTRVKFPALVKGGGGGQAGDTRLAEVEYFFDRGTGRLRKRTRTYPFDRGSVGAIETVVSGVKDLTISYGRDARDLKAGAGTWNEPRADESGNRGLPMFVRMEIELEERGETVRIGRTVVLPAVPAT